MSIARRMIQRTGSTLVVLALLASSTATAAVTQSLDSANFNWRYEFNTTLPSEEDQDLNSVYDFSLNGGLPATLVDNSYWNMNTTAAEQSFFMASAPDQIWTSKNAANEKIISWETGYTIEARVRVNSVPEDISEGAIYIQATANSTSGVSSWLSLYNDRMAWGVNEVFSIPCDNSNDFHLFRIAQEPSSDSFSVWRDDVLIGTVPSGYNNTSLDRIIIGDAGGNQGGNVDVDYLRFSPGAYAPTNEIVPDLPVTPKASSEFTYKYEMDVDPTDVNAIDLDGNSHADWSAFLTQTPPGTIALTGNGTLGIDSGVPQNTFLDSGISDSVDSVWSQGNFNCVNGFTVEISLKLNPGSDPLDLVAAPSDSTEMAVFAVGTDGQSAGIGGSQSLGIEGTTYDNTDGFHVFRISRSKNDDGGKYFVWRDDELLTPDGLYQTFRYNRNALYFGDTSGVNAVNAEVDYIRFMEGVFAPVTEEPIAGDANKDGKVDGSDVTILAGNWQAGVGNPDPSAITWEMGDFNGDGQIDGSDVTILAGNWQAGVTAAASAVPEPTTLMLLAMASLGLFTLRRKYV